MSENPGWGSIASVNNDATIVEADTQSTTFDKFMDDVVDRLNTMHMAKGIGKVKYVKGSLNPADMLKISPFPTVVVAPAAPAAPADPTWVPTWDSVTNDVNRLVKTVDQKPSQPSLLEAYRLVVARNRLVELVTLYPVAIKNMMRELSRNPFPLPSDNADAFLSKHVKELYKNLKNVKSNTLNVGSMETKMLVLADNTPLLWLGDVSPNLMASIEVAWVAIETTERHAALEQYVVGRVCQYLAEDWKYDVATKRFVRDDEDSAKGIPIEFNALAYRSFQIFKDLYGDRNNLIKPINTFGSLCMKIKNNAQKNGGLFSLDITHNKHAVARALPFVPKKKPGIRELDAAREYLRRRRCCDDAAKRVGRPRDSLRQSTELTLPFDAYDASYASIVVLVFLFYVSGMANQVTYTSKKAQPRITQTMLNVVLRGFKPSNLKTRAAPPLGRYIPS